MSVGIVTLSQCLFAISGTQSDFLSSTKTVQVPEAVVVSPSNFVCWHWTSEDLALMNSGIPQDEVCRSHGSNFQVSHSNLCGGGCYCCYSAFGANATEADASEVVALSWKETLTEAVEVSPSNFVCWHWTSEDLALMNSGIPRDEVCRSHGSNFQVSHSNLCGGGCYLDASEMDASEVMASMGAAEISPSNFVCWHWTSEDLALMNSGIPQDEVCRSHGSNFQVSHSNLCGGGCYCCYSAFSANATEADASEAVALSWKTLTETIEVSNLVCWHWTSEDLALMNSGIPQDEVCRSHGSNFQVSHSNLCGGGCYCCYSAFSANATEADASEAVALSRTTLTETVEVGNFICWHWTSEDLALMNSGIPQDEVCRSHGSNFQVSGSDWWKCGGGCYCCYSAFGANATEAHVMENLNESVEVLATTSEALALV